MHSTSTFNFENSGRNTPTVILSARYSLDKSPQPPNLKPLIHLCTKYTSSYIIFDCNILSLLEKYAVLLLSFSHGC